MRIVHISDIHLSASNFGDFKKYYRKALLKVLSKEHKETPIDIIAITGDLVDKGGHSLLKMSLFKTETDPYKIFEDQFITPIKNELNLSNANFVFIPGNHDVDESKILWFDEKTFQDEEVEGNINDTLPKIRDVINNYNQRIEQFKNFEHRFHAGNPDYLSTYNESTYIYEHRPGIKVGFALINDSWRCSTCHLVKHKDKKLYFGSDQLNNALDILENNKTILNVILTHHPIDKYAEQAEVEKILKNFEFHLHLYGDQHHLKLSTYIDPNGECFGIMARAGLNNPREPLSEWQPGFHIIDINFQEAVISCITYYHYIEKNCQFSFDVHAKSPDGIDKNKRPLGFQKVPLHNASTLKTLDREKYKKK